LDVIALVEVQADGKEKAVKTVRLVLVKGVVLKGTLRT
jgi:hypothetical protein